jgi:hypothetical protein
MAVTAAQPLLTEDTAARIDTTFATALEILEAVVVDVKQAVEKGPGNAQPITLEDIGALAVLLTKLDIDLDQIRRWVDELRASILDLDGIRGYQLLRERGER